MGAALQVAQFFGPKNMFTDSPCGGQGYYNPTQAGSTCSYPPPTGGSLITDSAPDPNDSNSGLLIFCDGILNNSCTKANVNLGISMHRMMNWDYGPADAAKPGYLGPYNPMDQSYLSQNVTANSHFLEYDIQWQYRGPVAHTSVLALPTFYFSNQYRQVYYPTAVGGISEINIPVNTTGADSSNFGAPSGNNLVLGGGANWVSLANTAGGLNLFTQDYVTIAWFYAPDFVSDIDPTDQPKSAGLYVLETGVYHAIDVWNAQYVKMKPGKNYHMKYVVFPYLYNESITTRFGTKSVQDTIIALNIEYQSLMAPLQTTKYTFNKSTANNELSGWSSTNAIDGNYGTVYSSNLYSSNVDSSGSFLAAWLSQPESISSISLVSRISNGVPTSFPTAYNVYVTTPTNSSWELVGLYFIQPEANGVATINFGQSYSTYGVMVMPLGIGLDPNGNHYFQIADMYCN